MMDAPTPPDHDCRSCRYATAEDNSPCASCRAAEDVFDKWEPIALGDALARQAQEIHAALTETTAGLRPVATGTNRPADFRGWIQKTFPGREPGQRFGLNDMHSAYAAGRAETPIVMPSGKLLERCPACVAYDPDAVCRECRVVDVPRSDTGMAALETALINECERAMRQRDEFLKTGASTASHGGSHDTLFGLVLRKHLNTHEASVAAIAEGLVLHPLTADLVVRFARALAEKLAASQAKHGWSTNWLSSNLCEEFRRELRLRVEKGDPRDVAAYCAFLWFHDEETVQR